MTRSADDFDLPPSYEQATKLDNPPPYAIGIPVALPTTGDSILDGFLQNKDEKIAKQSFHNQAMQHDVLDAKKRINILALAKEGDLKALACLGLWHLKSGDKEKADAYFDAAVRASTNTGDATLEFLIADFVQDPYEKAKYYRLAYYDKGNRGASGMIYCISGLPSEIRYAESRILLNFASFASFHESRLEDVLKMLSNENPGEFRKLYIHHPKKRMSEIMGQAINDRYFKKFQEELADYILGQIVKDLKDPVNTETINKKIATLRKNYQYIYHDDYFVDLEKVIQNRFQLFENTVMPHAIDELKRITHREIRKQLHFLKTGNQLSDENNSETDLNPDELNSLNSFDYEIKGLDNHLGTYYQNIKSTERAAALLMLDALKDVSTALNKSVDPHTLLYGENRTRFINAMRAFEQADTKLSALHTKAGKKAKMCWDEFIAIASTVILLPIVGIPLVIACGISRVATGSWSLLDNRQKAGKVKRASKKAKSGLFEKTTAARQMKEANPTIIAPKFPTTKK